MRVRSLPARAQRVDAFEDLLRLDADRKPSPSVMPA
jgi:hypothetical protein